MSDDDSLATGGAKKKTNTKKEESDPRLSLMKEIEIMISKSVERLFEKNMEKFMNQKTSNVLHDAAVNLELPKERRRPIQAGPYDIYSDNSSFAKQRSFNEIQGAHSFNTVQGTCSLNQTQGANTVIQAQGAYTRVDPNELILKLLQNDREEKKERKFERELNKIPEFSGDSKKNLDRFLTASSIAYNKINNQEQSDAFYDEILRKTSGSALSTIERLVGSRWNEIEAALRRRFAYLTVNSDVLRSKIEALKQNKNENMHDFAKRARVLVNERIKSYDEMTPALEREIEKSALKCFQRGIYQEKIRERVINMGASTLDGTFQNALEIEADMSFEVNKRDFYCKNCSITGHKTSDCKKNDQSDMARLTGALEKLANVKQRRGDFNKQSNTNSNFSNKNDANQNIWRKNGGQFKNNSNNMQSNGQKAIHVVQEQPSDITKPEIDHEISQDSDSSENSE